MLSAHCFPLYTYTTNIILYITMKKYIYMYIHVWKIKTTKIIIVRNERIYIITFNIYVRYIGTRSGSQNQLKLHVLIIICIYYVYLHNNNILYYIQYLCIIYRDFNISGSVFKKFYFNFFNFWTLVPLGIRLVAAVHVQRVWFL